MQINKKFVQKMHKMTDEDTAVRKACKCSDLDKTKHRTEQNKAWQLHC